MNIKKDYFWNSLGTSANAFISLLLLVVVTRINGVVGAGEFSFCFSYAIVFYTLGIYGGRIYQVSDAKGEFASKNYITIKFLTSAAMLVCALVFCFAGGYSKERILLLTILVLYKAADAVADSYYGVLQRGGELWLAGVSLTLKAGVGFVLFLAIDIATKNLFLAGLCLLFANIFFVLIWDLPQAKKLANGEALFGGHIRESLLLLKKSSWVFVFSLMTTLTPNIPRYFIDRWDANELGYFGVVIMPATLVNLFVTFLIYPKLVPLSERFLRGEHISFARTISKFFLFALLFGALATAAMFLLGVPILSFIYGIELAPYRLCLTLVVVGGTLNGISLICTNILSLMRRFRIQLLCYGAGLATLFMASIVLIPQHSILGAILSFLIANGVQALLFFASFSRTSKKLPQDMAAKSF